MKFFGKIFLISVLACVTALCHDADAAVVPSGKAFLRQMQKRDSVLIADQLVYGFRLENVKAGTVLNVPDMSSMLSDSVEAVSGWSVDTLKIRRKTMDADLEGRITITSFEEGSYRLPDIYVQRVSADGTSDTLVFEGASLEVMSMPVDTASFQIHDIKGQIRYPLTFAEILPYVLSIQAAGIIAALIWALWSMRRRKSGTETAVKEPPYITALRKLDHYRGNKLWIPEKQKQFYSGITDVLREYIAARYGVGAMEMTTAEIFEGLKDKDIPQPLMEEARNLFVMSDLVKFAKMTVSDEDNAKAVPAAVRFVTSTWKTEDESDGETGKDGNGKTVKEKTVKEKTEEVKKNVL